MELEGEVQGRQDQAQKIIEMPQRDRELPLQKISHHLLRWSPCMGRKGLVKSGHSPAFLASISNWQEHLVPRPFNYERNWYWQ